MSSLLSAPPFPIQQAFSVRDKVTIVTGAAGNIGANIAEAFVTNGGKVVLSDRDVPELHHAAERLGKITPDVACIPADLANCADLKRLVDQTVERFGRLDALINCGAVTMSGPITRDTEADFDRVFDINVRSIWMLTKYAIEPMKAVGGGSVVSISSIHGHRAVLFCSLYSGSKSALMAMTRELAVELAPLGIRMNTVSPGTIPNRIRMQAAKSKLREPWASQFEKDMFPLLDAPTSSAQPLPATGSAADIAMACLYLCSPAARFITGIDILVDGGRKVEIPDSEPRCHDPAPSVWQRFRQYLVALPDEAWSGEKPQWLKPRPGVRPLK